MTIEQAILGKFDASRNELAAKEAAWAKSRALLIPVAERLSELGSEPYMYSSTIMYSTLTGDVHKLVDAIRALRTNGFKSDSKPERKKPDFVAYYAHPDTKVNVLLSFSSSVCRRVKVGTKTETVDVYEVQCGESEEFAADAGVISVELDMPF